MWRTVKTARAVVDALGGNAAVCRLTGAKRKNVYHWKGTALKFPARTHDVMQRALKEKHVRAPASLWNQRP